MKLALALVLNAALLAALLPWARRQWRWAGPGWWQVVFALGLGLRVLVGIARNWTMLYDAEYMTRMGLRLTAQLWSDPAVFWRTFTGAVTQYQFSTYVAVYQNTSNTWFLIKALSLLNLGSLGVGWLNGVYLSVFAFVGCWQLVRCLAERLPRTPAGTGAVAFLLWPTVLYWTSGVSKEAVLLGSGSWLIARILGLLYGTGAKSQSSWRLALWWLGTGLLGILHFYIRYFFAAPLLAVLLGIGLAQGLQRLGFSRWRWAQAAVLTVVLGVAGWLLPQVSVEFGVNKFTHQVIRVYDDAVWHSDSRSHFEYADLRPTVESLVTHAPVAAANTLTRPWFWEATKPFYVVASLENLVMLGLLLLAVVALAKGRGGHFPFVWGLGLGVFCLTLAILIGLTTPNFGLLNRYRSALLPYFLLLALQNDYVATLLRWFKRPPTFPEGQ